MSRRCRYCAYPEDPQIAERRRLNVQRERHYAETDARRAQLVQDLQFVYRTAARRLSPAARAAFFEIANNLSAYR